MVSEIVNVGSVFAGIGFLLVCGVLSLFFWQMVRLTKQMVDKEGKYELFEELVLDDIAKKKGFDLKKAGIQREIIMAKSFRKKIQEEMIKEMFDKENQTKSYQK